MTDPNYTHLAFLLDRSGSMSSIAAATQRGFDAFIANQRSQPGHCTVTLAQFDDNYEVVYRQIPIAKVPPLQVEPRGCTALLDSLAKLINDTGLALSEMDEADRPGTVIIGVMTDGYENASTEFTHAKVKAMIDHQTQIYSWTFNYLGANQDAIEVGSGLGFSPDQSLTFAGEHSDAALDALSQSVARTRQARAAGMAGPELSLTSAFSSAERTAANPVGA